MSGQLCSRFFESVGRGGLWRSRCVASSVGRCMRSPQLGRMKLILASCHDPMKERLFYVGIVALTPATLSDSGSGQLLSADVALHVYVKAIDETYASAAASGVCSERGLVFRSFTYLPSEETESSLHPGAEHLAAFNHASRHGVAYCFHL